MPTLFFAYSHQDEILRNQLEVHLAALKRQGIIEAWHDRRILAGEEFNSAISDKLETANIILLLISPDFIASDYCYNIEMKRAMERHSTKESIIIPVILRPCDWHDMPFSKIQAVPKDAKPVVMWPNIDEAFLDIIQSIKKVLKTTTSQITSSQLPEKSTGSVKVQHIDRSSNLRIPKHFTERDRDKFIHDSFDYIAKYFENSLLELEQRNSGIAVAFRKLDSNRFTASIYRNGDAESRCTIFLHGFLGKGVNQIGYSSNDNGETTSFNECISVEVGEQDLYLKPTMNTALYGQSMYGATSYSSQPKLLSMQGGAEALWSMFIQPLQRSR